MLAGPSGSRLTVREPGAREVEREDGYVLREQQVQAVGGVHAAPAVAVAVDDARDPPRAAAALALDDREVVAALQPLPALVEHLRRFLSAVWFEEKTAGLLRTAKSKI